MRRLAILLLLMLPLSADEPLTNADVVKLVRAGLSAETIVAKIAASPGRFEVSTDALVSLAKDGVPDAVIRAMIQSTPAPMVSTPVVTGPQVTPAASPARTRRAVTRRYDVAVHRDDYAKCEGAELRVDGRGVQSTRCRGLDFELAWGEVTKACFDYGFRGTIVFFTKTGQHRISVTTPAEAKRIVEHVRANAPMVPLAECPTR